MNTQTESRGTRYGISNLQYDLMTLISEKSKGLEALQEYMQDAQGNQQALQLFQQLQQQDQQSIDQLTNCLKQALQQS